jgi:hypothetical protein
VWDRGKSQLDLRSSVDGTSKVTSEASQLHFVLVEHLQRTELIDHCKFVVVKHTVALDVNAGKPLLTSHFKYRWDKSRADWFLRKKSGGPDAASVRSSRQAIADFHLDRSSRMNCSAIGILAQRPLCRVEVAPRISNILEMIPTGIEPKTSSTSPRIWGAPYKKKGIYTYYFQISARKTLNRSCGAVVMTDLPGVNSVELRALRGTGLSDSSSLAAKLGVMLRS